MKKTISGIIVPIILVILSMAVVVELQQSKEDVVQASYEISAFEYSTALFACVAGASVLLLIFTLLRKDMSSSDSIFVTPVLLKIVVASIFYIVAMQNVGFYISTFLFSAFIFFTLYKGKRMLMTTCIYSGSFILILLPIIEFFNLYLPEGFLF